MQRGEISSPRKAPTPPYPTPSHPPPRACLLSSRRRRPPWAPVSYMRIFRLPYGLTVDLNPAARMTERANYHIMVWPTNRVIRDRRWHGIVTWRHESQRCHHRSRDIRKSFRGACMPTPSPLRAYTRHTLPPCSGCWFLLATSLNINCPANTMTTTTSAACSFSRSAGGGRLSINRVARVELKLSGSKLRSAHPVVVCFGGNLHSMRGASPTSVNVIVR